MHYCFQLNPLSPKVNWCTNKGRVKDPWIKTMIAQLRRHETKPKKWALQSLVAGSIPVRGNFLVNLFCSSAILAELPDMIFFRKKSNMSSVGNEELPDLPHLYEVKLFSCNKYLCTRLWLIFINYHEDNVENVAICWESDEKADRISFEKNWNFVLYSWIWDSYGGLDIAGRNLIDLI